MTKEKVDGKLQCGERKGMVEDGQSCWCSHISKVSCRFRVGGVRVLAQGVRGRWIRNELKITEIFEPL